MYKSLSFKINVLIVIVVTVITLFQAWYDYHRDNEQQLASIREDLSEISIRLATSLSAPLWNFNTNQIESIARAEMLNDHVLAIEVEEGSSGIILLELGRSDSWEIQNISAATHPFQAFDNKETTIKKSKKILGTVRVYVTDQFVRSENQRQAGAFVLNIGILLLLQVLVLMAIIQRYVVKPILQLETAFSDTHGEEGAHFLDTTRQDELGQLARSFIAMRERMSVLFSERDQRIAELESTRSDLLVSKESLRESEERFHLIFETNPDPVILAKMEDGAIIDVNKAFEISTGFLRNEVLGRNFPELGFCTDKEQRELFREQLQRHGEVNNFEATLRAIDGQTRIGLLAARLLNLNNVQYSLIVIRDITSEKEAERVLIEMDQMKSEFISTAAHELRTPLSAMMGFTELLIDPESFGGFTEEQKQEFLNDVYDRGESLSLIIDDLLDVSRIESGHSITLDLQKSNLKDILVKTAEFFRAHNVEYTFQLNLSEDFEQLVIGIDRHRINQVLENLLSNAVKYSPDAKEIVITGQANADGCEIRVEDQGIGMTQEQVVRIFNKFYRADASDTAVSGLGLGMSIAKQIVEAHGGSIRVESAKGEGSIIAFSLPYVAEG